MSLSLSPIQHGLVLDKSVSILFSSAEEMLARCPLIERHSISDSSHVNPEVSRCCVMQDPSYITSQLSAKPNVWKHQKLDSNFICSTTNLL